MVISLRRFTEGGVAIFAATKRNMGRDRAGIRFTRPLVKNKLRVPVIS